MVTGLTISLMCSYVFFLPLVMHSLTIPLTSTYRWNRVQLGMGKGWVKSHFYDISFVTDSSEQPNSWIWDQET